LLNISGFDLSQSNIMAKKSKQPFLGQGSLEAFVAYFDSHDVGDELDGLPAFPDDESSGCMPSPFQGRKVIAP